MKIPVSFIVVTKDEGKRLSKCLSALSGFSEVIVVDSASRDNTRDIAVKFGATILNFEWNGRYPKKRQWILDHVPLRNDWVFFVDADEILTPELIEEISLIFGGSPINETAFFIDGRHIFNGRLLRHGLQNSKLALFDRRYMHFPVVDDLDIPGMGEIEGHYQPVFKPGAEHKKIGRLTAFLIHDNLDDAHGWTFRHKKYARWESGMNHKNAWPVDPVPWREAVKRFLRQTRFRADLVFFAGYILKLGFLDGREGLEYARRKKAYYQAIRSP